MSGISFIGSNIAIGGVDTSVVATTLKKAGIGDREVAEIIGWWYVGATGGERPPRFEFATDVEDVDADCAVDYVATFEHDPWVDGEDRVQAGTTAEELGFNARFDAIANEFRSIQEQFRRLGSCVTDLRGDLAGVVRELEQKITDLDRKIADRPSRPQPTRPGGILGTINIGGKDAFLTQIGDQFQVIEFKGDLLGGTKPGTGTGTGIGGPKFDPKVIGTKEVVDVVGGLKRFAVQPQVLTMFGGGPKTVTDLRRSFGDAEILTGVRLGDVVASLPADLTLESPEAMVEAATAALAGELPEEKLGQVKERVLTEASRELSGEAIGEAEVTAIGATAAVAEGLRAGGVSNVAELANLSSTDLNARLAASGIELAPEVANDLVARARIGAVLARHR